MASQFLASEAFRRSANNDIKRETSGFCAIYDEVCPRELSRLCTLRQPGNSRDLDALVNGSGNARPIKSRPLCVDKSQSAATLTCLHIHDTRFEKDEDSFVMRPRKT